MKLSKKTKKKKKTRDQFRWKKETNSKTKK